MRVYTCRDRLEDIMSLIYDAWEYALEAGHENVRMETEPVFQQTIFCEYVHVDADMEKTEKVLNSIKKKISYNAYWNVVYAALSTEGDKLSSIYGYLRLGFKTGKEVDDNLTDPYVMRMMEIKRRVGREYGYFREFARFSSVSGSGDIPEKAYICHLEPKNNVIPLVGQHFADRMPSENWMIIDDKRKTAVVHPKDGENYIRYLDDREFAALSRTEACQDEYTRLWKTFFKSVSIKERENRELQRGLFPIWMRKHTVEFL